MVQGILANEGHKLKRKKHKSVAMISIGLIVLLSIVCIGGIYYMKSQRAITYTNPVGGISDIGDPFVLNEGKNYYMYATSAAAIGFKVWQSENLVDWEEKGLAYNHLEQEKQWATGDFWAPEVISYQGKYYMVYSARNEDGHLRISIAKSSQPQGPFADINTDIIKEDGSYIDGDIFIDEDGIPYLYYVKDCSENIIDGHHVSQIFVQQMNKDLTQLKGNPKLLLQPDQKWEGITDDFQWNEGPYVLKNDQKYYLMYSANFYGSADYGIGYAVADHPDGPFKKAEDNPILSKDLKHRISGPGHNSVTIGPDGKTLYIVYHTHTFPEAPSGDRQMNIDKLFFEEGKLKTNGPTHTEQKIVIE